MLKPLLAAALLVSMLGLSCRSVTEQETWWSVFKSPVSGKCYEGVFKPLDTLPTAMSEISCDYYKGD